MEAKPRLFSLLMERRFLPYFGVQFFGAFNDNVFKIGIIFFLTFGLAESLPDESRLTWITAASGVFILPFLLFSAFAGQFADKYRKVRAVRVLKFTELAIMLVGAAGLFWSNLGLMFGCLFLMGAQSAFFGPLKYSLLPETLDKGELLLGNGWVQAGTFGAILLGTLAGGILYELDGGGLVLGGVMLLVALAGILAALAMPDVLEARAPGLRLRWNPALAMWSAMREAMGLRGLRLAILGVAWFWFMGSAVLAQFTIIAKDYLGGTPVVSTILLALMTLGIAISSPLCSVLMRGRVRFVSVLGGGIGLAVFLGLAGMSLHSIGIYSGDEMRGLNEILADRESAFAFLWIAALALSSGFFTVPLYTFIQGGTVAESRARVVGASNFFNALFMVMAQAYFIIGYNFGATLPVLFLGMAVGQLLVAVVLFSFRPKAAMIGEASGSA